MLRRRPVNLNAQSTDATVSLIQDVLAKGVNLVHVSLARGKLSRRMR